MLNITITAYPHSWGAYTIGPYLFSASKSVAVLMIGSFCSANPPPIMIPSPVPWCSHQLLNEVWQDHPPPPPPPLSPIYILVNICRPNHIIHSISSILRF